MRSLNIAATGLQTMQDYVSIISQNLSNLNTTGYKMQRGDFQDLLYQNQRRVGINSSDAGTIVPTGVQLGLGVKTAAIYRNNMQGPIQSTENTLDMALDGKGYFQITLPTGETAYTRSGVFQLSPDGEIVTSDGYTLEPSITIPQDAVSISINKTGEVFATITGQIDPQSVGQIQLATFLNEAGLQATGDNLYLETTASGTPVVGTPGEDNRGQILQGFLEGSNVNPVSELTNLIEAQRAYDLIAKAITKSDEMMSKLDQAT